MYTVKRYTGEITHFATLDDVVKHIGAAVLNFRDYCEPIRDGWQGRPYCLGDTHLVRDELGLPVCADVLKHAYNNLPPYRWHARKRLAKPEHFRCMPVPHTSSAGNYSTWYRAPRTMQERRESIRLECDEELREYGIRPRRTGRAIPSAWDDICRNREKNWKRNRRTRWR